MRNIKTQPTKSKKHYFLIGILVLGWLLGILTMGLVASFNAKYALAFQSPVVIQAPVLIRQRASSTGQIASPSATLAPIPTPQPVLPIELKGEAKPDRLKPVISNIVDKTKAAVVKVFGAQHWEAMNNIIIHESNYNPLAVNPHGGACGLGQFLPCSKLTNKCPDMNVDCQIDAIMDYVSNRYGNPTIAWNFKQVNGWY